MKVTVLGSCVSRVSLLRGNTNAHGIADGDKVGIELEYFLDKHNIALAMMPPPFSQEEVDMITSEELWDKSRDVSLRQSLMKKTVPMLLEGQSEYLIMDFYDFHNTFISYGNTAFGTQANEFCNTKLCQKYHKELRVFQFFDLPEWIYYPLVDLFFDKIMDKFDANHIILNRFRANKYYMDKDGMIKEIPESYKQPFQCHDKWNEKCRALEDYVIQKYNPYVIDISKYFMGDANLWDNLNASHFEKEFYRETYDQIIKIIKGEVTSRYIDEVRFFDRERDGYNADADLNFNVEEGLRFFTALLGKDDCLGLNVLDKLYMHAPDDIRVKKYVDFISQNSLE